MAVNSVSTGYATEAAATAAAQRSRQGATNSTRAANSNTAAEATEAAKVAGSTDKFENTSAATSVYTKPTYNAKTKTQGMPENQSTLAIKNELVKGYVENTLKGVKYTPGSSLGLTAFNAAEATSKGLSAEEYWVSYATSERIFTFAKTLAGGNLDTLDKMEKAFLKGYNSAVGQITKAVGKAKVPTVTGETYDKVINKFADYRKELQDKAGLPNTPSNSVDSPYNVAQGGTVNGVEKPKYTWQTDAWREEKTGKSDYSYPLPDATSAAAGNAAGAVAQEDE